MGNIGFNFKKKCTEKLYLNQMHCVIQHLEALTGPHQGDTKTYSTKGYPSPTPPPSQSHPPGEVALKAVFHI